jgi:hypothetical protein
MKIPVIYVLLALLLCGATCRHDNKLLGVIPVSPTTDKISKSVEAAAATTQQARTDVQTAKQHAQDGDARAAVPPLVSADGKLGTTLDHLAKANMQIEDYKVAVKERDGTINSMVRENAKLQKENQKLRDSFTRKIRTVLGVIAGVLLLAGLFCLASKFIPALAFFPGIRLSLPLLAASFTVGFIAINLNLIMFWTGIVLGIAALAGAVWGFIHLLNYKPAKQVTVKDLCKMRLRKEK